MMKRLLIGFALFALSIAPCLADSQGSATGGTAGTQSTAAGCIFQSPSLTAGQQAALSCDASGNMKVNVASSGVAAAPTVSASGAVTSLVLKASATTTGVQYFHAENATSTSGYCILYNGSSAPGTGALTAANVLAFQLLPASGYCDWGARGAPPIAASTGAVLLLSSAATPFTYTTGTITGSIYGLAQ